MLLAEALGIFGIANTEMGAWGTSSVSKMSIDQILDEFRSIAVSNKLSTILWKLHPGNTDQIWHHFQSAHFLSVGCEANHGICPDKNSGIIEIGAGFGVLGYYLDKPDTGTTPRLIWRS